MSNILDEMRKRNMKMREIHNQYKLGIHPFLINPDAPIVRPPKDSREDSDIMGYNTEDAKSLKSRSPNKGISNESDDDAKTEVSNRRKYFEDFKYNDVLDDCYVKPFLDDEDWISSDEESEEERKNKSHENKSASKPSDTEASVGLSEFSGENFKAKDGSSSEEDIQEVNPEKVNWMKYIFSQHVSKDDQFYQTVNNPTITGAVLELILSDKSDEAIQSDMLELVGFDKIEMCSDLLEKREYIQKYCSTLSNRINREKRSQNTGHNPYQFSTGVSVTYNEGKGKKGKGKKGRNQQKNTNSARASNLELLGQLGFSDEFIKENSMLGLNTKGHANFGSLGYSEPTVPKRKAREFRSGGGDKKATYRQDTFDEPDWKEIHLTPPKKVDNAKHELVSIKSLPKYMREAFSSTESLNTIQSIVFDSAYNSTNNVLVAAPTGAGKTNIALLTILREVKKYAMTSDGKEIQGKVDMKEKAMKIVYLAPLKALAAEIVDKFSKALRYLNVQVREMTGDINLTKQEMKDTHVIVSTPEKWDVVTRKNDDIMNNLNLMIIDEIHLLNDERGTVLECLVSRALTTLVRNQKMIRILGLSATLPNYTDVADFIQAPEDSTYYFDPSYRPTPLRCRFYGVKDYGSMKRAENMMNEIAYLNIVRCLKMGKQVLVFVHKRNATVSTAEDLIEIIKQNPKDKGLFECENSHKMYRQVEQSKSKFVKELFMEGFGVHHAGMQRQERTLSEKLFAGGFIKILCTTATLAWGVNLPAYCTIIKGTQIFDGNLGEFKDIGIFDVQQIFGRAGRPQFDSEGEGIICTTVNKVDDYVKMMSNEQNIESHLHMKLDDCLNAEVSIGTVTNITEAIQWLKYTYFWIRLKKNPRHYGVDMKSLQEDPSMTLYMMRMVSEASTRLHNYKLLKYFTNSEQLSTTDMGRIACNYYVNAKTMNYFNNQITINVPEEKLLYHMAHSSEFEQIRGRPEEEEELMKLFSECSFVDIQKDEVLLNYGKTLILLESYLHGSKVDIADLSYIIQNSARLMRSLFDFCIKKNFARLSRECLKWCKLIDRRLPPEGHPLRQFTYS